jgi:hypothetical protein
LDQEFSFTASDAEGLLDAYDPQLQWRTNAPTDITSDGTLSPGPIVGPTYAAAVTQGASRPIWNGGSYTLTITDANLTPPSGSLKLQHVAIVLPTGDRLVLTEIRQGKLRQK